MSTPDRTVLELPGVGVGNAYWHALHRQLESEPPNNGLSCCGHLVTVASRYPVFDRAQIRGAVCPSCAWSVALPLGPTALAAEVTLLRSAGFGDLLAGIAVAVLAEREADGTCDEVATQLLATVSRHTPVELVDLDCAESGCEHPADGVSCPTVGWACPTCSIRTGSWAGEWEGRYFEQCTVTSPCGVIAALADFYQLDPAGVRS